MAERDDDLQLGASAPGGAPGASLEAEEKAMKGGKGGMIAGMAVAGIAVVGLFAVVLFTGSDTEAYENFGKQVNGLDRKGFDSFWGCALQMGVDDFKEIRKAEELIEAVQFKSAAGKRWGDYVEQRCMPKLEELESGLGTLIPPDEVAQSFGELKRAARAQRGAWSDYIAYLKGLEEPFDAEAADAQLKALAKPWFDYRGAHGKVNAALREQLGAS